MTSVLAVASNDTHVRMFGALRGELDARDAELWLLSLDAFYSQGATPAAERLGLVFQELERPGGRLGGSRFYSRSSAVVWLDVLRARVPMRTVLHSLRPDILLLGNDRGLLEKLAITEARRSGISSALLQDGRLARSPRPSGFRRSTAYAVKRALSRALRSLGLSYLAASEFGAGGTDVICASGPESAALLRSRASPHSRIVVTGQPRYDGIRSVAPNRSRAWDAVMFTSPFEHAGLGAQYQRGQEAVARQLATWATASGRRFAVKPHPREDADTYRAVVGEGHVIASDATEALEQTDVAVIGISTLLEEASFMSCPVVVPGTVVHGTAFDNVLPPRDRYPRADTAEELQSWLEQLRDPDVRRAVLDGQTTYVAAQVTRDPDNSASARVVDAILN